MRKLALIVVAAAMLAGPLATAAGQSTAATTPCTPIPAGTPVDPDDSIRDVPYCTQAAADTAAPKSNTAALILIAIVAAALIAAAALIGWSRFTGTQPRWMVAAQQALAEAGWRASGAWDDFRDWLRTAR